MFFCPECHNGYDITKTLPTKNTQQGGSVDSDMEEIINKIASNENLTDKELKQVNDDLLKSNYYKKLTGKVKELVYNKVMDNKSKEEKKQMIGESKTASKSYFICKNCGQYEEIKPKTMIISRSTTLENPSSAGYDDIHNYKNMIHAKYLPHTRNYICPNKKCESYKDDSKRDAVFFRKPNTYQTVYVCTTCESVF